MKKLIKGLLLVPMMFLLVGCGAGDMGASKDQELSDAFDKEKLKITAQEVINNINNDDYDKIFEIQTDQMKELLTVEKMKETFDPVKKKLGEFKSFEEVEMIEKDGLVTVSTYVQYKNAKVKYMQAYTTDMKLAGLYVK